MNTYEYTLIFIPPLYSQGNDSQILCFSFPCI